MAEVMDCRICRNKQTVMKRCMKCKNVYYCSKECQIKDWPMHRVKCRAPAVQNDSPGVGSNFQQKSLENNTNTLLERSTCSISIKCNHKLYRIEVNDVEGEIMNLISDTLCIPLSQLKLVGGGKVINKNNIREFLFEKRLRKFMAFGEVSEDSSGLEEEDICLVMKKLNISRNIAIRGLKKCNGDVVDAILSIGNDLE